MFQFFQFFSIYHYIFQFVCALHEWKTGIRKNIHFSHNLYSGVYNNMLISMETLEKDPYQHMKLLETRRNWASSGKYIENSVILRGC